jgi:hypothetical protein
MMRTARHCSLLCRVHLRHLVSLGVVSTYAISEIGPRQESKAQRAAHDILDCIINMELPATQRSCNLYVSRHWSMHLEPRAS